MTTPSQFFLFLAGIFIPSIINGATIPNGRIVGGEIAEANEFPWQVSFRYRFGQHFCGGTLISKYKVLTAAHCVNTLTASSVHVVTGSTSLAHGGEYHAVSDIVWHEDYIEGEQYSWRYDIAIVTLATPAEVSANQSPIEIGNTRIPEGSPAVTSGWGLYLYPSNALPAALQKFNLTVVSNTACQDAMRLTIYDDHMCAMSTFGEGVCSGDSGGPLVVDGKVVGIASWVRPCGVGYPDVYTSVSSYYDWIMEKTEDDII